MEVPHTQGLTQDEDDALRRLAYFAENAGLSEWSRSRLSELRSRDRRDDIRLPREITGEEDVAVPQDSCEGSDA